MEIEWAHCEQGWWAGLSRTCSRLGLVPKALTRSGRFCLLLFGLRLEQGALYTPDAGCTLEYLTLHFREYAGRSSPGQICYLTIYSPPKQSPWLRFRGISPGRQPELSACIGPCQGPRRMNLDRDVCISVVECLSGVCKTLHSVLRTVRRTKREGRHVTVVIIASVKESQGLHLLERLDKA